MNFHVYLAEPHPLDVGVLLVTDATNTPVGVHSVDNSRFSLGSLQYTIIFIQ